MHHYGFIKGGERMSFWSRIGLPDKNDIKRLQNEINLLKEENKAYTEMNNQLIKLIGDVNNKCDLVSGKISDDRTQMDVFIADSHSEIDALRFEISKTRDNIFSVHSSLSDTKNHLQLLSAYIKRINSCVSTISDIDSELKSLTEYVNCLWSATKALWVNSIASDLDNV
jgi:predicted  nucleic acid-binding Zn-ribbon protein